MSDRNKHTLGRSLRLAVAASVPLFHASAGSAGSGVELIASHEHEEALDLQKEFIFEIPDKVGIVEGSLLSASVEFGWLRSDGETVRCVYQNRAPGFWKRLFLILRGKTQSGETLALDACSHGLSARSTVTARHVHLRVDAFALPLKAKVVFFPTPVPGADPVRPETPPVNLAEVISKEFVEQCLNPDNASIKNFLATPYFHKNSCVEADKYLATQEEIILNEHWSFYEPDFIERPPCYDPREILRRIVFDESLFDCSRWEKLPDDPEATEKDFNGIFRFLKYRNIKKFQCNMCVITSLEGIEHLTSLTELWVAVNRIRDLSPLKSLRNLEHLQIGGNPIEDGTPLLEIPSLKQVNANGTNIAESEIRALRKKGVDIHH